MLNSSINLLKLFPLKQDLASAEVKRKLAKLIHEKKLLEKELTTLKETAAASNKKTSSTNGSFNQDLQNKVMSKKLDAALKAKELAEEKLNVANLSKENALKSKESYKKVSLYFLSPSYAFRTTRFFGFPLFLII